MAKRRFSPEQVVAKLRLIEVLTAAGKALPLACKEAGITDVTYYRWRKEYGGLKANQAKRMKDLAALADRGKSGLKYLYTYAYRAHAIPGARAPHLWVDDQRAIFDCFGRDFTLLCLEGADVSAAEALAADARKAGVPLDMVQVTGDTARELYGANHVLIRPDHHIGWRGNRLPQDFGQVLGRARGAS